jgi:8-oxo-dGTP pyrophosphatase MutT (NUDIX family)
LPAKNFGPLALKPYSALLQGNLMGLEKEGLRVSGRGGISQAPHPKALGCASEQAITRELNEELGIQVKHSSLHQTMVHHYEDRIVELSIYNINQYQHTPIGLEGQAITWARITDLNNYQG